MTVHQKPNTLQLESFWMPFTANRQFKAAPRLFASAEGMHYTTVDGRKVIDGSAGLWCVNAGHGRKEIAAAVGRQLMNGEALRPEQGYPLRAVIPGWEGNLWVKWLRRIEAGDKPWAAREETARYTDLLADGRARQYTFAMKNCRDVPKITGRAGDANITPDAKSAPKVD